MAHTGGWDYTTEQDREMREASSAAAGGVLGGAMGKSKSLKGDNKRKLGKRSRHGSQRSTRHIDIDTDRVREDDENTRTAAAVRRSRSERRKQREEERDRDKEIERGLRGLPIKDHDERARKEKPSADRGMRSNLELSEKKEKDIG
jgi:hypothetical protein